LDKTVILVLLDVGLLTNHYFEIVFFHIYQKFVIWKYVHVWRWISIQNALFSDAV